MLRVFEFPESYQFFVEGYHWLLNCTNEWPAQTVCQSRAGKLVLTLIPFLETKPEEEKIIIERLHANKNIVIIKGTIFIQNLVSEV
jgi:hypothetical protein